MGANVKSVIPQSIQSLTEPQRLQALSFDFSSIASLREIRRSSQFLPVIVLIPKSLIRDQALPSEIVATQSMNNAMDGRNFGLPDSFLGQVEKPDSGSESVVGDVRINFSEMTAFRKGQPITMTAMEFKALKYLIQNPRRVISRDELLNEVWGYQNYPSTRTVDNHILRLRQKLEREPSAPQHFITVHRTGYKFLP
jgi:DNA-binding response OmpR family regulator